jgi:uncharacterized protein (DUF952 family)
MGSKDQVCPSCGQPVGTVVRRHKTLGVFVPVWRPGPCRNPKCPAYAAPETGVSYPKPRVGGMSEPLLHLTERSLWEAARATGTYEMSTRDRTLQEEGFIHCSLRHQVPRVAGWVYGTYEGPDELVLLVIDPRRLTAPVRYEAVQPGGEEFPHIYGPIPVSAVVDVEVWNAGTAAPE